VPITFLQGTLYQSGQSDRAEFAPITVTILISVMFRNVVEGCGKVALPTTIGLCPKQRSREVTLA
ncbi:MAG: hypothetical protein AAFY11_06335, partial [Cyanobacteria bacterium J06641_5]